MLAEVIAAGLCLLAYKALGIWADRRVARWEDVEALRQQLPDVSEVEERLQVLESAWEIRRGGL